MGAMYLEAGLDTVQTITIELLENIYPDVSLESLFKDHKTTLQELTQARFGVTPEYRLTGSQGPDHKKEFEVAVTVENKEYGRSVGKSKKIAQQEAAKIAIRELNKELS